MEHLNNDVYLSILVPTKNGDKELRAEKFEEKSIGLIEFNQTLLNERKVATLWAKYLKLENETRQL